MRRIATFSGRVKGEVHNSSVDLYLSASCSERRSTPAQQREDANAGKFFPGEASSRKLGTGILSQPCANSEGAPLAISHHLRRRGTTLVPGGTRHAPSSVYLWTDNVRIQAQSGHGCDSLLESRICTCCSAIWRLFGAIFGFAHCICSSIGWLAGCSSFWDRRKRHRTDALQERATTLGCETLIVSFGYVSSDLKKVCRPDKRR